MSKATPKTLLEAVTASLRRAGRYDPGTVVPPAAILWPDGEGQWQPLISQLRTIMPELLVLGEYDPKEKTGPAIWLRCVIERMPPEGELVTPIIYMPGVNVDSLRTGEECPDSLKPLVELQYRGTVWRHQNGKDWTVEAFLVCRDELGLDMAKDRETRRAMLRSLSQLAVTPLSRLQGTRLEAADFDRLMISDPSRELLLWLDDPGHARKEWSKDRWAAFCACCKGEYGFDPEGEGELVAAEKLGLQVTEAWKGLWSRYAEAPASYPGIPDLLKRAKPRDLIHYKGYWPDENEAAEDALRQSLLELEGLSAAEARQRVLKLDEEHGKRRTWVWAQLGQSPLAVALEHLVDLARKTTQVIGGDSPRRMADLYVEGGFLADDAVLKAIGSVKSSGDVKAVANAISSIYLPWLNDGALHLQALVVTDPESIRKDQGLIAAEPGQCLLFVDGLRFDIGQRLVIMAKEQDLSVNVNWRWAALPTITATAKPAVSPIAEKLSGDRPGEDFAPGVGSSNPLTTARFRKMLEEAGYQVFGPSAKGSPGEANARGWTEYGEFDQRGHSLQSGLADHIDDMLRLVLDRIRALLDAGWRQVRAVTDHGWLLVPGGLPGVKLPKYLTESRWLRCASIKSGSHVEVPAIGWHWNPYQPVACAPGARCFTKGHEYAHGGISLQECLIPDLTFHSMEPSSAQIKITNVQWVGMRCRLEVEAGGSEVTADLRTKPNAPHSSITTPKQSDPSGSISLLVGDDSFEGDVAHVVLLDSSGRLLAQRATTVGGEDHGA
ncbi:MAG: BREX-1 system phosphatase PglZ type B [Limnochordia bacterium]|jgi:hypothetical protein